MINAAALRADNLSVAAGATELIRGLNFELQGGNMLAVLGRNGSGKSLLLHTLAGLRPAQSGTIQLQGSDLTTLGRRDTARRLSLLPQDAEPATHVTVFDWVLGGRFAHNSDWQWPSESDRNLARQSLQRVQLESFAKRWMSTLSGGESRRAALATLLTQDAPVMLLDEPTNHLDPRQITAIMQIARDACDAGAATIVTLHDPQLALRWADQVLLLHGDGRWRHGNATETLSAAALSDLYQTPYVSLQAGERRLLVQDDARSQARQTPS